MSYIHIYVHFVWSTKRRAHFLTDDIRPLVFQHIRQNAKEKNIYIDHINGYTDHVHCLVSLNEDLSISQIARLLKGESSHWINSNSLTKDPFAWQNKYFAIGVGDEKLDTVRRYIANQEDHHKQVNYQREYELLIKRYGFDSLKNDD